MGDVQLTNFEFLSANKTYASFAGACIEAEKALVVSPATCAILSRRALELAVKWLFTYDSDLKVPYQDNLSSLIHDVTFLRVIDQSMLPQLKYITKLGNIAVHSNATISRGEAILSLRNLHNFISWIDYCYSVDYTARSFDEQLLLEENKHQEKVRPQELQDLYDRLGSKDRKLEDLIKENEELRKLLAERKAQNTQEYDFVPDQISEYETRKRYIDLELKLAGWIFNKNVEEEFEVQGMPNGQGSGYVDYVLFGENGKPLAVVEAKRTSSDPNVGKQQAKLYADCLEQRYGQRPLIYYTNGFVTNFWDDLHYASRQVSGFASQDELQLLLNRRSICRPLQDVLINNSIVNRPYQHEAVLSVCDALNKGQRTALLVMATGSGKTRTASAIVDVLSRYNWVKNVLFLADRTTLVRQAKNSFSQYLPDMTLCNLLDSKDNPETARIVFSTYPTMMNAIDEAKRKDGKKLFTVGHFDLIIIDESHRSVYKKYKAIFEYFDAILLGLTATPKDEVDKNTYDVFRLENGVPTFAYELEQAVKEGHLVDYRTVETTTKIMDDGIRYDDLSEEEKEQYEEVLLEDEEEEPRDIDSAAINEWLFNQDTIDRVLQFVMERGLKVEGGDKLGKTIIFAKNHRHAVAIVERFDCLYPKLKGHFARVIDIKTNYYQSLIDDFSIWNKLPQIAVSVDMLDTGVDIPEVVNLVFFKRVRSKSKFWQMVGRGTRLCKDLHGIGEDKKEFLIFDFCRNFEFFRANPKGKDTDIAETLSEKLFNVRTQIVRELQQLRYQEPEYIAHRAELVKLLKDSVSTLNEEHFRIRQHIQYVHKYKNDNAWHSLSDTDMGDLKEYIAPLVVSLDSDELAKRFDYMMLIIELAKLQGTQSAKPIRKVIETAEKLSKLGTIPQIVAQRDVIEKVMMAEFWEEADIFEMEKVRVALRDLIKFLERETQQIYYTNFKDEWLAVEESRGFYNTNDLQNYRKKVNQYLQTNKDQIAIYKLRNNKQITKQDLETLEHILWAELGTKEDYEREYKDLPVTKLVRKVVGLDQEAANEAFMVFLQENRLNVNQLRFVKLIIDYVVKNGIIEKSVLQEEPFRSVGSITELFSNNLDDARAIIGIIDTINKNAEVAGA
ncbi:Type-1 restriction enzyme R protein [Chlamydia abortus]|uniref:DEAD/DEAH box helicase family protein n=1 Tax=Paenibacillus sp. SAFN-117 TaxID=3436860 RepID=UPI000A27CD30|nr:Type-1 restriction enzyme R protein [Chlamydia abortus]